MNMKPWSLESFDSAFVEAVETSTTSSTEEAWLEVFEKGYKDGWEDALRASQQKEEKSKAELASNLSDLSFTYQEAKSAVLKEVRPLFEILICKFMPSIGGELLARSLLDQLNEMASEQADIGVEVVVSPGNCNSISDILKEPVGLSVKVVQDATLSDAQAFLRFGATEQFIDLDGAFEQMSGAVNSFFREVENEEHQAYG